MGENTIQHTTVRQLRSSTQKHSLLEIGKQAIVNEIKWLQKVQESLNESFVQAVQLLCTHKHGGRIVCSGVGKAGLIARKVSASLSSVGLPSYFLHPSEALHGDLGSLHPDDIALFFSNSGETTELISLIQPLNERDIPIVAVTGDAISTLGRNAQIALAYGHLEEACPLGLAPTTTATAMLVIGHALMIACMEESQLTADDYGKNHPGGSIGKQFLALSAVMRRSPYHCIVTEDIPVREVVRRYTATPGRPGAATIVDKEGKLAGIFTDGNLRRFLAAGKDFLDLPIKEAMTKNPKCISEEKRAQDALRLLSNYNIDQAIVVNTDNEPTGLIDIQDLMRVFSQSDS